jgi:MoaA/NifB/PqqE/SkfB family radical SAM enzyme
MPRRLPGTTLEVPLRLSPGDTLASVDAYITSQCNRRCTYCFMPSDFFASGMRMSLDTFSGAVSWSRQHGIKEITLLGGEPSLHPSFAAMVSLASNRGMDVRVVTNGARRFRRLLEDGSVDPKSLSRVAVSMDTLDETVQDRFRGPGALRDAKATIALLRDCEVAFDINVTAVLAVLGGLEALIDHARQVGCRRVNVHWPSAMGIGSGLDADQIPDRYEWEELVRRVESRVEKEPDFFVEIERGFLAVGEQLTGCALTDFSNLQILPDGRAYRCGLLVDQAEMASLSMTGDEVVLTRPGYGEELLRASMPHTCDGCPVMRAEGRRACIYDKVSSQRPG